MQWKYPNQGARGAAVVMTMALLVLSACESTGTSSPQTPRPVATVAVIAPRLTMHVGEQMTLVATPKAADGEVLERQVAWTSGDASLATVNASGVVTAVAPGPVTITASTGGRAGSVTITLAAPEPPPVARVILTAPTSTLEVGETVFVGVRLELATGEPVERAVTWTSSAPLVATATAPEPAIGVIRANGAGMATITASVGATQSSVTFSIAPAPTHDLIYTANDGAESAIYLLGLGRPSAPVRMNAGTAAFYPSASPDGTRLVFAVPAYDSTSSAQHDLYIVNRDGSNPRQLTNMPGMSIEPKWSPDGTRIVFRSTNGIYQDSNIWIVNADGTGLANLTGALGPEVSNERQPAWSPDGRRIAFIAARAGLHKVWTMDANGRNAAPLMTDAGYDASPTWSPAGDRIAFARYDNVVTTNGWDVMIVSAAGGVPTRLALPGDQLAPAWSPDGEYIAVAGTRSAGQGAQNLYTMRPDGTALRLRTVEPAWGGGNAPAWIARNDVLPAGSRAMHGGKS